ncbi:M56 family metallopeptidase [Bythopirellula goksoeyrii]|uniref:Regulatory protein BlaR1 n=1 Tax=Bythopirellula goksoeyrii TaxID=1400387 RepID=A0A5B9QIH5_9BACT|nr:M56 family metallopeptidase [Bythopirellula goksoeyrii]QEG37325.1 Regulatory protein BlaR1 [Bythopirellula goksoeyrii]
MSETFDSVCEFIVIGLEPTFMAAIAAIPVAMLVLATDRIVGRRFSPRILCWLWVVVAVRLLMPIAPISPVSVQRVWHLLSWESKPATVSSWEELWQAPAKPQTIREWMANPRPDPLPEPIAPTPGVTDISWDWESVCVCTLCLLWFAGVILVMLRAIVSSWRFSQRIGLLSCVEDQPTIDCIQQVCASLNISRTPQMKYVPDLSAPAIFGVFRPTLCLPEETRNLLSSSELRMIALHELMHLRRRDGYLSWMLMLVRAFHWFNPIAWITIRHIEHYRELACDHAVRKFTEPQERTSYANLLMRFAAQRPATCLGLLGLGFASPAKNLAARIEAFTSADNRYKLPKLVSVTLLFTLALIGFTDAATDRPTSKMKDLDTFSINESDAWKLVNKSSIPSPSLPPKGELETRQYDLSAALKKIRETRPEESDGFGWLSKYLLVPGREEVVVETQQTGADQIMLTAPETVHQYFNQLLNEVERFGNTWQVVVCTRVLVVEDPEELQGIDWKDAVRYAAPHPARAESWSESNTNFGPERLSLSMESISVDYAPYVATILSAAEMDLVVKKSKLDHWTSAPKITIFSGQVAKISDLSQLPFVVGVTHLKGEFATAAQPCIEVLSQGMELGVKTSMTDRNTIELQCQLELNFIDGVSEAKMPGQDLVIQIPKATHRTISARCNMKQGETLLIAPTITVARKSEPAKYCYYAITTEWFPDPIEGAD